jgi:uncharacterized cupin superfamily protein
VSEYGENVWAQLDEIEEGISRKANAAHGGGPDGAHTVVNRTDGDVRYVMVAAHTSPDIIEYPDKGTLAAGAKTPSQRGERFFVRLPLPDGDD